MTALRDQKHFNTLRCMAEYTLYDDMRTLTSIVTNRHLEHTPFLNGDIAVLLSSSSQATIGVPSRP